MSRLYRIVLIILLLFTQAKQVFAGTEPYKNFIKGQLHVGDSLIVKDEKFKNPQFNWADITNISVHNRIELSVLQEQPITQNFDCEVEMRVEYFSSPEQVTPTTVQLVKLKVEYRIGQAVVHKLIDHYAFMNGHLVKVFITKITSPQYGENPPPILELTNSILIDRQYKFTPTIPFTLSGVTGNGGQTAPKKGFAARIMQPTSGLENTSHQLKLEWGAIVGAEEYDIEWTAIDKPGDFAARADSLYANITVADLKIDEMFRNNATRVTTDAQSYIISLLYSSKYLAVRMRQVHYDPVTGLREEGNWDYMQVDNSNNYSYAIWELTWHETNLNWQFSASFAEQGKKKEVVSYFDGTLRNRQTATLNNGDNVAVIQENVYDEYGRPIASFLPAPYSNPSVTRQYLHYFPSFNMDSVLVKDVGYSSFAYNLCGIYPLNKLKLLSGASKYYSPNNTFANSSYVPDAKGYPFSLTQYTGDNTGKVKVQGGVGETFMTGVANSHTTKYFYGKPEQWELDRIFGNDVGYAEHYLKQIVVDPNGQASVNYLNSSGKTIATALVGSSPANQSDLSSQTAVVSNTSTLLNPSQFAYDPATQKFTAAATYISVSPGDISLKFQVNKLIDLYQSGPVHPCSNCDYFLKIKVVDDCGTVYKNTTTPIEIGTQTADCDAGGLHTEEINFYGAQIGEYYISFEMAISPKVVEGYVDAYIKKAETDGALTKQYTFIKAYIDSLDFKPLFADCRTAVNRLGSQTDFVAMVKSNLKQMGLDSAYTYGSTFDTYITGVYTSLYNHAVALEGTCNTSPCEGVRSLLASDVSPGGQYALFDKNNNPLETAINILYNHFRTVFPVKTKSDPMYWADTVVLENNETISPFDASFTVQQLAQYWKPQWADLFINKHPEYCKLEACEARSSYLTWDEKLTELYKKESDITRISSGLHYDSSNAHWLLPYDPFFASLGSSYYSAMQADLDYYSTQILNFNTVNLKNLSQYVTYSLYCADSLSNINPNNADGTDRWNNCSPNLGDCRIIDREWDMYKTIYLQLKQKYYDLLGDACSNPLLACLTGKPYDYGAPGTPGVRDFAFHVDSVVNGYQHVSIRTLNGPITNYSWIWFDPTLLAAYPTLRNYVAINGGTSSTTFLLPDSIPVSALKIIKVQNADFEWGRIYMWEYFQLVNSYEIEGGWYYYEFGLNGTQLPPNNAFDEHGGLSGYVVTGYGCNSYFWEDLYFNTTGGFKDGFSYYGFPSSYQVDGYADYPIFPLGSSCPPEMATKVQRFPTGGGFQAGWDVDEVTAKAQGDAQLEELIKSSCETNADNWMRALGTSINGLSTTNKALLKARLIALCVKGGSMDNPSGTSTLPSGVYSSYGDNSFSGILTSMLGTHTMQHNPWLLESPPRHDVKPQTIEKILNSSSNAICTKLNGLRPSGYNDEQFYTYLVNEYGSAMNMSQTDFNALLKSCSTCKFLIATDVKLPFLLDPDGQGCITRTQYNNAMSTLASSLSGGLAVAPTDSLTYMTVVTNYLNQTFGFGLGFEQYDQFRTNGHAQLCNEAAYVPINIDAYAEVKSMLAVAVTNGQSEYEKYITEERNKFKRSYLITCSGATPNVQLTASNKTYHYTLYYYDQAENLVRTVPPEGVKFLTATEMQQAADYRNSKITVCSDGPSGTSDKLVAFQKLADVLGSGNKAAVEQWLFNAASGRHFMATTPNKDFIFNTCISGNYATVEVYTATSGTGSMTLTLSNKITVNISSILPLQQWTHVVVQANNLASGTLDLYVNGAKFTALSSPPSPACSWVLGGSPFVYPEDINDIKYMRLYTRLMQPLEIAQNATSSCRNASNIADMFWYRFNAVPEDLEPQPIFPDHLLPTSYVYDSQNQIKKQKSPDAGESLFAYDDMGRLVFSQNAKQNLAQQVSYTIYDGTSRIKEVGQINDLTPDDIFGDTYYPNYLAGELVKGSTAREQIVETFYDAEIDGFGVFTPFAQENLRKRVSATTYRDTFAGLPQQVSYYSYDLVGNVKTLGQKIEGLDQKRLDYDYDLWTGKLNFLAYQNGQTDAFYYKYEYDAENRLTKAWSATDAVFKPYGGSYMINGRADATYAYYLHGPLRRMELGYDAHKVQGSDYVYTLQGWLKGVNGVQLNNPGKDVGNDGATIGKDVLAYSLGYYQGDYTPIKGTGATAFNHNFAESSLPTGINGRGLYNGNISHSTYAIGGINGGATVGYTYGYDQLNRLKNTRQRTVGTSGDWDFSSASHGFKENFTYDGNGNITALNRYDGSGNAMDSLKYAYNRQSGSNRLLDNRLGSVDNDASITGSVKDSSYGYDAIGNLISNPQEDITNIDWTVFGKIRQITKTTSTQNIAYTYDPAGNRVSKTINGKATYYVRDAQGNTMAVYDKDNSNPLYWREQQLYGSSRLGLWQANIDMGVGNVNAYNTIGNKRYELNNHLGNVMAVISDSRTLTSGNYEAQLVTANDYYAFGSQMPGRSVNLGLYRYGFNGKENDNEVKGDGNQQDYGMRIYDPRIGKFLSVDPISKEYPELTPYQFASNMPIAAVDLDGLEAKIVVTDQVTGFTKIFVYGKGDVSEIVVRTYKAIIQYKNPKGQVETLGTFNVTRDGWYDLGTNSKGNYLLHNRSSDPKIEETLTIVNRHSEQYGKGTPSFTISPILSPLDPKLNSTFFENGQPNGDLDSEVKRDGDYAKGAEFHVGGYFQTIKGLIKLAGTYGCYGVVDPSQVDKDVRKVFKKDGLNTTPSNDEMRRFGEVLKKAEKMQKKDYGNTKKTEVEIEKRDYNKTKEVRSN
ncbi:MAG: RHS repeat-associated core domain-containing protein [Pedobacter sp.]|nr:RHS repeat-associated core domain-containing protein [Pedobacter sp.]